MKKLYFSISAFLVFGSTFAQDMLYVHKNDLMSLGIKTAKFDSLYFSDNGSNSLFNIAGEKLSIPTSEIDSITFHDFSNVVTINFEDDKVRVVNPMAYENVSVAVNNADVVVTSTSDAEVEYVLSGATTNGSFKVYSDKKLILNFNGVSITNPNGAAVNIQSGKKITVLLNENTINNLVDGASYVETDNEDMKATFFSEGQLVFTGDGTLNVTGNGKHGICSDDYIKVESGNINVLSAAKDGIHVNDYVNIQGGNINITSSSDGIDAGEGYFKQSGGNIVINSSVDDVKGIKSDSIMSFSGGTLTMTVSGDQSKAIKFKQDIIISGGTMNITTSGKAIVENNDPSYCTAIKSDADINITGGEIVIKSSGLAGKGISADGNILIEEASIDITTTGNGSTYTNTSNTKDSYSANCIKADLNMNIISGNITTSSTGTAGKGIVCDGIMTIGTETSVPVFNCSTSGAKFTVSGSGMNVKYANPKVIKSVGDMIIHNGNFTLTSTKDGGEGLESKSVMTINNGDFEINTVDDCINSGTALVINGGNIYCYSSGNDGIDSNGTLTVTGGVVIASGTNTPEEGFDCDNNMFKITGGILIGTGGATSNPTSQSTQNTVVYKGSGTNGQLFNIRDASGNDIVTYKIPRTYSTMTLLFSSPDLTTGTKYYIYTGGSVSGGTDYHGFYSGATYTPGSTNYNFTPSGYLTNVGTSTGGGEIGRAHV